MAADYKGHHARNGLIRCRGPRKSEIIRAIPEGSRRLRGRKILRLYADAVTVALGDQVRADARANCLAFARDLAAHADWHDGTTRSSRAARCASTGLSESTWKACRRRLEDAGLLGTVTPGRKYWHGEDSRSDAAVYLLCIPKRTLRAILARHRPARSRPLSRPPTGQADVYTDVPRGATADQGKEGAPPARRPHCRGGPRNAELVARGAPGEGRAMAELLRTAAGYCISDGWAGHLLRPFLRSGWSVTDVRQALEWRPDGTRHPGYTRQSYAPVKWLHWRLAWWADRDGRALASPSARRAAANQARAERQAAERQAHEAREAARAQDPSAHLRAIFAAQGWRQPKPKRGNDP